MTVKEAVKYLNKPVFCRLKPGYHEYPKGIYILREIRQSAVKKDGKVIYTHHVSVQNTKNDRDNYEIDVSDIYPPGEEGEQCSEQ